MLTLAQSLAAPRSVRTGTDAPAKVRRDPFRFAIIGIPESHKVLTASDLRSLAAKVTGKDGKPLPTLSAAQRDACATLHKEIFGDVTVLTLAKNAEPHRAALAATLADCMTATPAPKRRR